MIFIVYDSAQTPVRILLFDLWIPFSSDLQAVTSWTQISGPELATDTLPLRTRMRISLISLLTYNGSLKEPINRWNNRPISIRDWPMSLGLKEWVCLTFQFNNWCFRIKISSFWSYASSTTIRQYKQSGYYLLSNKTYLFILSHLCFIAPKRQQAMIREWTLESDTDTDCLYCRSLTLAPTRAMIRE